jgi:hypothetical protein
MGGIAGIDPHHQAVPAAQRPQSTHGAFLVEHPRQPRPIDVADDHVALGADDFQRAGVPDEVRLRFGDSGASYDPGDKPEYRTQSA